MVRRTVNLPDAVDALITQAAEDGESYSAAVTRLVESAAGRSTDAIPDWIGAGEGPGDLGRRAEDYLRDPTT